MENNNIKSIWKSIQEKESSSYLSQDINITEIIKKEHGTVLTKMLYDTRKELIVSSILLTIWIGLLLYAFEFLSLHFSLLTNLMFGVISLFLIFSCLMGVKKYYLISKEDNTSSIKESFLSFRKRMLRANITYIIVLTAYFYLLMARIIFVLFDDYKVIHQSGMFFPILSLILLMIGIPWLIKYEFRQRFRKLFRNLDESMQAFNDKIS